MQNQESTNQAFLWAELVREFRHACVLRLKGREQQAVAILNGSLREAISRWAKASDLEEPEKQETLRLMFKREEEQVQNVSVISDVMECNFNDNIVPGVVESVTRKVTESVHGFLFKKRKYVKDTIDRQVPIGDVAGMIDSVLDSTTKSPDATRNTPRRRARARTHSQSFSAA